MQVTEERKVLKTWISRTTQPRYNPLSHNQLPFSLEIQGAQFLFAVAPYPVSRRIIPYRAISGAPGKISQTNEVVILSQEATGRIKKKQRFRDGSTARWAVAARERKNSIGEGHPTEHWAVHLHRILFSMGCDVDRMKTPRGADVSEEDTRGTNNHKCLCVKKRGWCRREKNSGLASLQSNRTSLFSNSHFFTSRDFTVAYYLSLLSSSSCRLFFSFSLLLFMNALWERETFSRIADVAQVKRSNENDAIRR